jgi:hypothetical protein
MGSETARNIVGMAFLGVPGGKIVPDYDKDTRDTRNPAADEDAQRAAIAREQALAERRKRSRGREGTFHSEGSLGTPRVSTNNLLG